MPTRRQVLLAETTGSTLLGAVVVGGGIAAARLAEDPGLALLVSAVVTGAALAALVAALGPVSAAFNPVVTLATGGRGRVAALVVAGQVAGCALGVVVANLMFDLDAITVSATDRLSGASALAEGVATFGLVLVVLNCLRSGRTAALPLAVGGYVAAAHWFTSSTAFANPAITLARTLTDTYAGIAPASVAGFVVAQCAGAAAAWWLAVQLQPVALQEARP